MKRGDMVRRIYKGYKENWMGTRQTGIITTESSDHSEYVVFWLDFKRGWINADEIEVVSKGKIK